MHRCKKLCVASLLTTYIEPLKSDTPADRVKTKGPRFNRHDGGKTLKVIVQLKPLFIQTS